MSKEERLSQVYEALTNAHEAVKTFAYDFASELTDEELGDVCATSEFIAEALKRFKHVQRPAPLESKAVTAAAVTFTTLDIKGSLRFDEFSEESIRRLLRAAKKDGQQIRAYVFAKGAYPRILSGHWTKWDTQRGLFVSVEE